MDIQAEAARLLSEAERKPLKLPVNRRVDESHHAVTAEGLGVWYTVQVSPHSRIYEAVFEREDRAPTDAEVEPWLAALFGTRTPAEAPGLPGAHARRFEVFERAPEAEAPLA